MPSLGWTSEAEMLNGTFDRKAKGLPVDAPRIVNDPLGLGSVKDSKTVEYYRLLSCFVSTESMTDEQREHLERLSRELDLDFGQVARDHEKVKSILKDEARGHRLDECNKMLASEKREHQKALAEYQNVMRQQNQKVHASGEKLTRAEELLQSAKDASIRCERLAESNPLLHRAILTTKNRQS